jgi:hypothetical protein
MLDWPAAFWENAAIEMKLQETQRQRRRRAVRRAILMTRPFCFSNINDVDK